MRAATRCERGLHVVVVHKDAGMLMSSDQALPIGAGLCTIVQFNFRVVCLICGSSASLKIARLIFLASS